MLTRREVIRSMAGYVCGVLALDSLPAISAAGENSRGLELIELSGDAKTVGTRFGGVNAEDVRKYTDELLSEWRLRGLSEKAIIGKSEPFRRFTAKFAPAWAEEDAACAAAAGVKPELYTAFLAGKFRGLFLMDECTSFFALGDTTADGATIFHKNRDNRARRQCAYRKQVVHSTRPAAFWATGDTCDSGVMMMVNEHGLAGSADTGGLPEKRPKGDGVMNPYILRLIAERAECCEDALEIIQEMIRDGWYAGGAKTGTHWLFADRRGRGLRVAQNAHEERHWFHRDEIVFSARGNTEGAKIILRKKGGVTVADANAAATHESICFPTSISGMTVRMDAKHPGELSSVWFALPCVAPYSPLYPLAQGTPKSLLDGSIFAAGRVLSPLAEKPGNKNGDSSQLKLKMIETRRQTQEEIYRRDEIVQKNIQKSFAEGNTAAARNLATQGALDGCSALMNFLITTQQSLSREI